MMHSSTSIMVTGSKPKAILLCGGEGKRMFPFSLTWKKCLLPIQNESNIHRIVRQLRTLGIDDIVIVTDSHEKEIRNALKDFSGLQYSSVMNRSLSDTLYHLSEDSDEVLLHYGDVVVTEADILRVLNHDSQNVVLVEACNQGFKVEEHIGAMIVDGAVQVLYPHPRKHYANARTCGVYKINKAVVSLLQFYESGALTLNTGAMPRDEFVFEEVLNYALESSVDIKATFAEGIYVDLNFPWDVFEANMRIGALELGQMDASSVAESSFISEQATVKGHLIVGKNTHIGDRVVIEGNCKIGDDVVIDNGVIIGKNCVIGNGTKITHYAKINDHSVIGPQNKIGFGAEVTGVTFTGVAAVHACEIFGVIGNRVDIAAGVQMAILKFDDTQTSQIQCGRRYANDYTNAIFLGDFVRTGIGNLFYPGIKVGPRSALGPGLVINRDVDANKIILLKQEWIEKEWGSHKYGW